MNQRTLYATIFLIYLSQPHNTSVYQQELPKTTRRSSPFPVVSSVYLKKALLVGLSYGYMYVVQKIYIIYAALRNLTTMVFNCDRIDKGPSKLTNLASFLPKIQL